jgi:cytochrome c-type protein NapB
MVISEIYNHYFYLLYVDFYLTCSMIEFKFKLWRTKMIKQSLITIATLGLMTVAASAYDTKACAGCHGADFEKAAMGKSKIVKDMNKDDIVNALKGYKDGSYGGAMKAIMAGQAKPLSDEDMEAIATQIAGGDKKEEAKAEDNATKAEDNATKTEEKTAAVEVDTKACAGCHGTGFEKAAMGKSKIVSDMSKADIETALKGYKDGSYGGAMKAIMAGQAKGLDDAKIKAIAEKFGK